MKNFLRNRQIGVVAALTVWVLFFAVDTYQRATSARLVAICECRARLATLTGAVEMYALDQNQSLAEVSSVSTEQLQARLQDGGYIVEAIKCGEQLDRFEEDEAYCPTHKARLSSPREEGFSETFFIVSHTASLATWIVFPLAFWIAIGARSARWGRRYAAGQVKLLPASWVVVLNLFCPPAGLFAMARWRAAAVQSLAVVALAVVWDVPFHLATMPAAIWVAVARFFEERARPSRRAYMREMVE